MKANSTIMLLAIAGCSPSGSPLSGADTFALRCVGPDEVTTSRSGRPDEVVTQPQNVKGYYWDGPSRTLRIQHDMLEPEPLCRGEGQEVCKASVDGGKLVAEGMDLMPGKGPNDILVFQEKANIDLNTLTGTAFMRDGTARKLGDAPATFEFKVDIRSKFRCERVKG